VRGARQVGKTYSIREFGKQEFPSVVEINFESMPRYKTCFEEETFTSSLRSIELLAHTKLEPGKTLLFPDEM
jgi:predicted AAA+ superfamily ATPase